MKNIKKIIEKIAVFILGGMIALIVLYNIALWVQTDFNPYFSQIDSCLDYGGRWDYKINKCEK